MMNLTVAAEGLRFPEGPVAMKDGSIILVETERGTLTRVDGAIYVCNNGGFLWHDVDGMLIPGHTPDDYTGGSIQRVDLATGSVETLYAECDGVSLRGPNDIVFDSSGNFWFTDYGKSDEFRRDHGAVYYARADGSSITKVRGELLSPNGIGLSPDEKTVYFADTQTGRLWAIDLDAPGVAAPPAAPWLPGRLIATLPGYQLLDSLKVEQGGRVCVGTLINGGITVFQENGAHEHLAFPDLSITNLVFGGDDMQDVWATGSSSGKLYKLRWPRPGLKLAYYA